MNKEHIKKIHIRYIFIIIVLTLTIGFQYMHSIDSNKGNGNFYAGNYRLLDFYLEGFYDY